MNCCQWTQLCLGQDAELPRCVRHGGAFSDHNRASYYVVIRASWVDYVHDG